jgi:hypothetical protein
MAEKINETKGWRSTSLRKLCGAGEGLRLSWQSQFLPQPAEIIWRPAFASRAGFVGFARRSCSPIDGGRYETVFFKFRTAGKFQ